MHKRRNQPQLRNHRIAAHIRRYRTLIVSVGLIMAAAACGGDGPPPPEVEVDLMNNTNNVIFMTSSEDPTLLDVLNRLQLGGDPISVQPGETTRLRLFAVGPHTADGGCIQDDKWFFTSTTGRTRWLDSTSSPPTDAELAEFVLVEKWEHGEVCFDADVATCTIG